jgi:hypothetical protein
MVMMTLGLLMAMRPDPFAMTAFFGQGASGTVTPNTKQVRVSTSTA